MRIRAVVVALSCCLIVSLFCGIGAAGADQSTAKTSLQAIQDQPEPEFGLAQDQPEPDNTVTRITVRPDGTAVWTITFRTRLTTSADVTEYEQFQSAFENDTAAYLDPFEQRMRGVVSGANLDSEREMTATDFNARTSIQEIPRRWGTVTFEFTWEGFASGDSTRLVVGDAFGSGFYIGENDVLEIATPGGFEASEISPTPDEVLDGIVEWQGREDFGDGQPRIVFEQRDAGSESTGDESEEPETTGNQTWLLALLGLLTAAGAVYAVIRHQTPHSSDAKSGEPGDTGETTDEESIQGVSESGTVTGSSSEPAETDTASRVNGKETALLSDGGRVKQLLREHDGRLKQSEIVENLGWSKSKTSRVLSRMEDEGTIKKLRIGRENIIDLSDEE